jgi:hypothetical protein
VEHKFIKILLDDPIDDGIEIAYFIEIRGKLK